MKYIRTKDGRIEETFDLNINDIKNVENLWCDFHLDNGVLHFTDYFPKEKQTLEILQKELKNVVFVKRKINSDYYDYDYEPIEKEEVLKQADTIEELCDEFVYEEEVYKSVKMFNSVFYNETLIKLTDISQHCFDIEQKEWSKIYGAIWTDKGLQFVARMNNEGVLELL